MRQRPQRPAEARDGSYRITGQKIFISAGDHDMAENVIHLVLAKAPGGDDAALVASVVADCAGVLAGPVARLAAGARQ